MSSTFLSLCTWHSAGHIVGPRSLFAFIHKFKEERVSLLLPHVYFSSPPDAPNAQIPPTEHWFTAWGTSFVPHYKLKCVQNE